MENSLISIIIPVHNGEKYIKNAYNSCVNQNYENLEMVFVDDGSTDNSLMALNDIAREDTRVKVIHSNNMGVASARNIGLDCAEGAYVSFLDVDDELYPNAISLLVNDIEKNGSDISCGKPDNLRETWGGQWSNEESFEKSLQGHKCTWSVWSKLFRRNFLKNIRFEVGKKYHEDVWFMFLCMSSNPKVSFINDVIYHYTNNPDSASKLKYSNDYLSIIYFADKRVQYIQNNRPDLIKYVENTAVHSRLLVLMVMIKGIDNQYKKDEREFLNYIQENGKKYTGKQPEIRRFNKIVQMHLYYLYKLMFKVKYKLMCID